MWSASSNLGPAQTTADLGSSLVYHGRAKSPKGSQVVMMRHCPNAGRSDYAAKPRRLDAHPAATRNKFEWQRLNFTLLRSLPQLCAYIVW